MATAWWVLGLEGLGVIAILLFIYIAYCKERELERNLKINQRRKL